MMAAVFAGMGGSRVELFERNEKLGVKLFITGKGRGNLTNAQDLEVVRENIVTNGNFMYSSLYAFSNEDVMRFFEKAGVELSVERGGRVFPKGGHAYELTDALKRELHRYGVKIHLKTRVKSLIIENSRIRALMTTDGRKYDCDSLIVATGGLSYPSTGSTGDGYILASQAGLRVSETSPSLTGFNVADTDIAFMQGLALKNVSIEISQDRTRLFRDFGELLFTHFGVSGPLILSASAAIDRKYFKKPLTLRLNLKSALSDEKLDERLKRELEENRSRKFSNSLGGLFPRSMIPVISGRLDFDVEKKCAEISRRERRQLFDLIRNFSMKAVSLRGFDEAIITRGGVEVDQINPSTMETKTIKGLFFAGEVLDIDAMTGGYNLQAAWSTGAAAGRAAAGVS